LAQSRSKKPSVILIVEDEVMVRMHLADLLTEAGYRIIAMANADHAMAVIGARPDIELLFTDIVLPGAIDGCTLARAVNQRWPQIGLLVASGKTQPSPGELPDRAHFIAKPYSRSDLLPKIEELLAANPGPLPQQREPISTGAPVLPAGIFARPAHSGLGHSGALAEPTTDFQG
jgi:DNA-binding NtrC family response regulator